MGRNPGSDVDATLSKKVQRLAGWHDLGLKTEPLILCLAVALQNSRFSMIDLINLDNHEVVGWQLDLHGCKIPPLQKLDSLGPPP